VLERKTLMLTLAATCALVAPLSASAADQQPAAQAAAAHTTTGASTTPTATTPTFTTPPATSTTPTATTPTFTTPPATTTTAPPPATTTTSTAAPNATVTTAQPAAQAPLAHVRKVTAHLAAATSDTIVDYAYSPATITVNVGDTVTWTNSGHQPHTATASNGSFDTGTLNHGQSGSHTFTTAGTFAYICSIHPYMHGTVVVRAASSNTTTPSSSGSGSGSTTGSSSGSDTSTGSSTTGAATSGSTLPTTGLDVIASAAAGLALLGLGLAIRRRISQA
jgi:LPXTG-motif cell wall-anchored protein